MVEAVGARCKTPLELSQELGLEWRGYLIADDKHIGIGGKDFSWYVAVDKSGDIIHADVMKERTVTKMAEFFQVCKNDLDYRMKGLTTDQEVLFRLAYKKVYPSKPHQLCLQHALESLDRHLGYVRQAGQIKRLQRQIRERLRSLPDRGTTMSRNAAWEEVKRGYEKIRVMKEQLAPIETLRKAIRRVLFSNRYALACSRWANFHHHRLQRHPVHRIIVEFVKRRWESLTIHYHHPGMPNTNNIAENTMRQLERRLKTIEGFGNLRTARGYMNLLIAYLRTKPFTDCRGMRKYRNGLSRLELAGATLPTKDWLKICLKTPETTNR
jgi:transposase-like protein